MLERGAVEGEIFHRGAVQALAPDEPEVLPRLAALVRHELIRPDRPQFPGEDAFRFRHLLIRDAAYDALPKGRARRPAPPLRRLARGEARRSSSWTSWSATTSSKPPATRRSWAAPIPRSRSAPETGCWRRGGARSTGTTNVPRPACSSARSADAAAPVRRPRRDRPCPALSARTCASRRDLPTRRPSGPRAAGDETGEALARAMALFYRGFSGPPARRTSSRRSSSRHVAGSRRADDHAGLAHVWYALGFGVANGRGRVDEWAKAVRAGAPAQPARRSLGPARDRSRDRPDHRVATGGRGARGLDRHLAETSRTPWLLAQPRLAARDARPRRGGLAGRPGGGSDARETGDRWGEWWLAEISTLAGDHEDASRRLRVVCDWLEATEQYGFLATYFSRLGRELCMIGRFDEAERCVERARALDEALDGSTSVSDYLWRQVHGTRRTRTRRAGRGRAAGAGSGRRERAIRLAQRPVPRPLGPGRGPGDSRAPRRGGSRARAGARTRRSGRRTSRSPARSASGSRSCGRRRSLRSELGRCRGPLEQLAHRFEEPPPDPRVLRPPAEERRIRVHLEHDQAPARQVRVVDGGELEAGRAAAARESSRSCGSISPWR